ncbi:TPA: TIM barrel protein [Candidatus Micrarchaeota archaeon]|nr:MAG: hypothetical protein AUJ65_04255 [Candidatus Micrarchaeota archaeon CG1_02_51_15]HII38794.1 TIM barrel protein [Candidatus Micrarchaeota archaeon]
MKTTQLRHPTIIFGTAGVPAQCQERSSLSGIRCVRQLGLDAMELEFVRGCRMSSALAEECAKAAKENNVILSAHASYYLNLLSLEKPKYAKTVHELLTTARVLEKAGGGRLVFHPGFYLGKSKDEAMQLMKNALGEVLEKMAAESLDAVRLSPETTGKPTAFGSLEELMELSAEFGWKKLAITIDWAHVHARDNARIKGIETYRQLLDALEKSCGREALWSLHCHMSGINFSSKGELNHLPMECGVPPFPPLAQALHEFNCGGVIISESPNIEKDALWMKKTYATTQ